MGLNMESQNLTSNYNPITHQHGLRSDALEDALLLLSRLFGRQTALDFLRDTDILQVGESE